MNLKNIFIGGFGLMGVFLFFTIFTTLSSCSSQSIKKKTKTSKCPEQLHGIVYTEYGSNGYSDSSLKKFLSLANQVNANHASVLMTCYVPDIKSSQVNCDSYSSPKFSSIENVIRSAQSQKLSVSLRVYIDIKSGVWRALWKPDNPTRAFQLMQKKLIHYAEKAEALGVSMLIIGAEYEHLTRPQYTHHWEKLINAIRKVYSGPITYGSNGNPSQTFSGESEYQWIRFWDKLDFVGIDHYPSLKANNSQAHFDNFKNQHKSWLVKYKEATQNMKPILFTEVGFPLAKGGVKSPYQWKWPKNTPTDSKAQSTSALAFLNILTTNQKGALVWRYMENERKLHPKGYVIDSSSFISSLKQGFQCKSPPR